MKKIVARLSGKHRKVGVGKDDVAKYGIKKEARSDAEAAWSINSLPPKPNITYIEANLYAKNTSFSPQNSHTKNALSSHHLWKEKRKSHLTPEAYPRQSANQGLLLSPKGDALRQLNIAHRAVKTSPTIASTANDDCPKQGSAKAPTSPLLSEKRTARPPLRAKEKAALRTAKKANAQSG